MSEAATSDLHLVQLRLDGRALERSRKLHGLPERSGDLGYLVHGQLAACFGALAPKPFRVRSRGSMVEVLGYSAGDKPELEHHLATFAEPIFADALVELASKKMPETWSLGQRLGFEVRACPIVRLAGRGPDGKKKGAEVDAFLQACWSQSEKPERGAVYGEWLGRQMAPAASLASIQIKSFGLPRLHRKGAGTNGSRPGTTIARPDALMVGELEITDADAFAALVRRGVGRHRAFGFGLLLLRPPGRH